MNLAMKPLWVLLLLTVATTFVNVNAETDPNSKPQGISNGSPVVASMKFVSCPGCKLNHLPEVKRFLREVIEVGDYPGVTVEFIPGRLPEVFMYDAAGVEIDKMYIEKLGFAELNTLVRSKGFRRKGEEPATR